MSSGISASRISVSMLPRSFFTSIGFFQKSMMPMVSCSISTMPAISFFNRCR